MPRIKPPFPVQVGLFGKPTVINNVETFFNIPPIVAALLLGNYPSMTEAQVRSVITGNVRAFPSGSFCYGRGDCGSGLLDANLALRAAAVAYAPPSATASASVSQVDTATEQVITLSVLASAPMTNGTLTYQWSQVGNTPSVVSLSTPTASTTTFTKPAGKHGTYSFQVVVTDMSNSKTTTKTVSVTSNTPPVLADVADMSATVGQALSFTHTVSGSISLPSPGFF